MAEGVLFENPYSGLIEVRDNGLFVGGVDVAADAGKKSGIRAMQGTVYIKITPAPVTSTAANPTPLNATQVQ